MFARRLVLNCNKSLARQRTMQRAFFAKKASNKDKDTATFEISNFETHLCDGPKDMKVTVQKDEMVDTYRLMQLIRRVEVASDQLYKRKAIRGFLHLYNGQEAVCAGMELALRREDAIITAYRDHGWFIGRGGEPEAVIAEMLGKITGCSKGNGGSMHLYEKSKGFYGGNGIVGAQGPLGTGIAFAQKYREKNEVCVTLYGDGAANQGQLYEAYNMASLWKLPVIYVCENNLYGMGTSIERASNETRFYTRGDYIPGMKLDGMDVLAVRLATQYAREHASSGKGPFVLEMETYRYAGHSMSDPGTAYRTREEVQGVRSHKDPIERHRQRLLEVGFASKEELQAIDREIKSQVDQAVKNAEAADAPSVDKDLFANIHTKYLPSERLVPCELPASFAQ